MAAVAAVPACSFSPSFRDDLECGAGGHCPPGYHCDDASGLCREGGATTADASLSDRSPAAPDAPASDASADASPSKVDAPPSPDATPPDAAVDATPVECDFDVDCMFPLDPCALPGTCTDHTCVFPQKDCTGLDGECTVGECRDGACQAVARNEGMACGPAPSCSYGACGLFSDECDESGMQSGTCTTHACAGGVCTDEFTDSTIPCDRDTDGAGCGLASCGPYGACSWAGDECAESGVRTRICTPGLCTGGVCGDGTPFVDSASCTRSRPLGYVCVPESCGTCGPCFFGDECTTSGTSSCPCSQSQCSAAHTCAPIFYNASHPCTRPSTEGNPCNGGTVCSDCEYPDTCANMGSQTCTSYGCRSEVCSEVSSGEGLCFRNTDGDECDFFICPGGGTVEPICCKSEICLTPCGDPCPL